MMTAFMILLVAAGTAAVAFLLRKGKQKSWKAGKRILSVLGIGMALLLASCVVYVETYYRALPETKDALTSTETVKVGKIRNGYRFDGPGEETAIIFYPGGKVECEAYAPLLHELAERGQDAFLIRMPLRLAFLGIDRAEAVMREYGYSRWYMMGHSLGGAMAAEYAGHHDAVSGIIFLASYGTGRISENQQVLSIYGSEDGVLNRANYEKAKANWPESAVEMVIPGGNHAGFGTYGPQQGDHDGKMTAAEQQRITAEEICRFIERTEVPK